MNTRLSIPLLADAEQLLRLRQLQAAFAEVCNALAPQVQATRCWNRVALHHMAYKSLRDQFPALGSQMVCNAIYSVSRMSRLVYQDLKSPFNVIQNPNKPLPVLQFTETSPVYFDRHTLSLKGGKLSMYTLDGRMHFKIDLEPADEERFHQNKLKEVVLSRRANGRFELSFLFSTNDEIEEKQEVKTYFEIPEYILIEEAA